MDITSAVDNDAITSYSKGFGGSGGAKTPSPTSWEFGINSDSLKHKTPITKYTETTEACLYEG